MKHNGFSNGVNRRLVSTLPGKIIRGLLALPLMLCVLIGFVIAAPLWLAGRFGEMLRC